MKAVTRKQIELAKHDSRWIRAEDAEQEIKELEERENRVIELAYCIGYLNSEGDEFIMDRLSKDIVKMKDKIVKVQEFVKQALNNRYESIL